MRFLSRCAFTLILLAACQTAPRAQTTGTPGAGVMFRGGADHSGRYDSPMGQFYGGLAWRVATEGPIRSSPAVTDALVLAGSGDGSLYAIERASGRIRWRFAADAAVNASPAVSDGTVYFASLGGTVYAVALADGQLRWKMATGRPLPPAWAGASGIDYFVSSPVLTDATVIVGAPDGMLYALARSDGSVTWRGRTEGRIHSSPAVRNGLVFVGSFDGSVYAFDLRSGARRWRFDTEGRGLESEPVGYDRRSIISSPSVTDSTVFIGSRDGHIYAIDAATGKLRWRVEHDDGSWSISSPAVADGVVYDASSDARFVHALSAATGEARWRIKTPGSVWSSAAIAGNSLIIGDNSGVLHGLDRATGTERWSFRAGGGIMSSPVVAGGVVYVGSSDGAIYAVRLDQSAGLSRAVYWDSAQSAVSRRADHRALRDALVPLGYEPLAAAQLSSWMEQRIRDRHPSVVILATDQLPASFAQRDGVTRRYLAAGGKIVSPGDPPFIWPAGPDGGRGYSTISRETTSRLLDVDHARAQFDRYGARPTDLGREWGLTGWWQSTWSIEPPRDGSVLALDERGLAAAWVKNYGGPRGTGFVQVNRGQWSPNELGQLTTIAEYRPE